MFEILEKIFVEDESDTKCLFEACVGYRQLMKLQITNLTQLYGR